MQRIGKRGIHRNHLVFVNMKSNKEIIEIPMAANNLKGTGMYIMEDLSKVISCKAERSKKR